LRDQCGALPPAGELEQDLERDLAYCTELDPTEDRKRNVAVRFRDSVAMIVPKVREHVGRIGIGLLRLVAWLPGRLHLQLVDRWFLKLGKIEPLTHAPPAGSGAPVRPRSSA
jgi:hypothetical protein